MIAADQAARRPLMTLSEQIRLWVINLDMESMPAVGFIRVSLTPEAWCSCCEATRVGKKKGKRTPAFASLFRRAHILDILDSSGAVSLDITQESK